MGEPVAMVVHTEVDLSGPWGSNGSVGNPPPTNLNGSIPQLEKLKESCWRVLSQ